MNTNYVLFILVGCIVFAWDNQTSVPFWSALKMQPVLSDAIPCFKALVTIHKLLVNGPHVVLSEACNEVSFLEQCARIHGSQNGAFSTSYGYGPLISSYVSFLLTKIDFHRTHPEFTGNFDYEEYLSIRGVQDLDEGYKTIDEMMELEERLDQFQKSVFENFGAVSGSVECRISAFVPLIDESYGMYKFVTSMLSAMHLSVESPDPLILLVERYNGIFGALKEFYEECSKIRYLTSLVAIPKLPDRAPQFSEEALKRFTGSQAFHKPTPSDQVSRSKSNSGGGGQTTVVVQIPVQQAQQPQPQPQASQAMAPMNFGMMPTGMYDSGLMQRVNTEIVQMQSSLQVATQQHHQDQAALEELRDRFEKAEGRAKELTQRYNQLASQANSQGEDLREQLAMWKRKYEATAKLYTELRDRYMQLASKLSESSKTAQQSRDLEGRLQELELARMSEQHASAEKDVKLMELEERCRALQGECEALRLEECVIGGEIGGQLADELARAAAEIATAASKLCDLRRSVGDVHEDLLDAASSLTSAISDLVREARSVQESIVQDASLGDDVNAASFYKKNSVWTAGLISAAQAVASATSHLVETADALLRTRSKTPEHLIVASTGVTASTAQLMAAARVKANPSWPCSEALEGAARAVSEANRALVTLVTSKSSQFSENSGDGEDGNLPTTLQGFKIAEMDQQVEILALERQLQSARIHLARLRQSQYKQSSSDFGNENDCEALQQICNSEDSINEEEEEDNALPQTDDWLLTIPPKLEEVQL
jgi:hypothetical protein